MRTQEKARIYSQHRYATRLDVRERQKFTAKRYMANPKHRERKRLLARESYERRKNNSVFRTKRKSYYIGWYKKLKDQTYLSLGGYFCVGCRREIDPRILSIDHIKKGGSKERKVGIIGSAFYKMILDDPEAKKNYRILCMNCQFLIKHGGELPRIVPEITT